MAVTRRELLSAAIGDSFPDDGGNEGDGAGAEAFDSGKEEGFPFRLLSGPGVDDKEIPPPVPTRVKANKDDGKKEVPKKPPRGTAAERQLAEIGENLEEKIAQTAMLLSGVLPVTSVYGAENSPKAVAALLSICKRRPKWLGYLEKAADGIDALELAKFFGGLVVAFQVDMGRMKGDEMPAQAFGVTSILAEFFSDQNSEINPAMEIQVPRFVAV